MIKEEGFEVDEPGKIGDGSGEGEILKAEDSELVEASESVRCENTSEI